MGFYSHKTFICPFFKQDERLCIRCEGGKIKFPDRKAAAEFQDRYCASHQWQECSVAQALNDYYNRKG